MTPSDIKSALGIDVRPVFAATHGVITTCTYLLLDRTASVSMHFTAATTPASFAAARALFVTDGETVTPMAGLGDEAVGATARSGQATVSSVLVRKGSTMVSVTGKASIAQVRILAGKAVPGL